AVRRQRGRIVAEPAADIERARATGWRWRGREPGGEQRVGCEIGPGNLRRILASGVVDRLEPGPAVGIARARIVDGIEAGARRKPPRGEIRTVGSGHCCGWVVRFTVLVFAGFTGFFGAAGSSTRSIETRRPLRKR